MAYGLAVIAGSGSLSSAVQVNYAPLVTISVPTIDSATLTFMRQNDPDDDFRDCYDDAGNELTTGAATTGGWSAVIPWLAGAFAVKVRSGTSGTPVAQSAAVTIPIGARTGQEG